MEKLEERKGAIHSQFSEGSLDPEEIQKLSVELGDINKELEEIEEQWMELVEAL